MPTGITVSNHALAAALAALNSLLRSPEVRDVAHDDHPVIVARSIHTLAGSDQL
jgi:hypothetical protein